MSILILGVVLLLVFYILLSNTVEHFGGGTCARFLPDWMCYFLNPCIFLPKMSYTQWIRDFICGDGGCPEGKEKYNGLCYTPCKDGFKTAGIAPYMCYKQYPEFENNGMSHTFLNVTKSSKTVVGKGVDTCKGNRSDKDAGLCYEPCKKGMKGMGPMCWNEIHGVGVGVPMR